VPPQEPITYATPLLNTLCRGFAWTVSKLFWSIRYHGRENIPATDAFPYILASNHQAYFDPAWIVSPIKQRLAFMTWGEAFEWKFIGAMIRRLGAFPVSLEGGAKALGSVKKALRALKDGAVLIIFPEGERAFENGQLLDFKEGVASIAIRAQVPVLPVTIKGGNRVWAQGHTRPHFFTPVEVTYHPLIYPPKDVDDGAEEELTNKLRDTIAEALDN